MKHFAFLPIMLLVSLIVFGVRFLLRKVFGIQIPDFLYVLVLMAAFGQIAKKYGVFKNRWASRRVAAVQPILLGWKGGLETGCASPFFGSVAILRIKADDGCDGVAVGFV
jgi:cytochrome c biogenesis protein CcdA